MTADLSQILQEQDDRDLHGGPRPAVRVNHLSLSSRTVREVFDAVAALPKPAVRSGHVGNWREIWRGHVGLIDYNRYICRDFELGVPLLHAHTFTENADLTDGDTIYLPAGRITEAGYQRLELFVKMGSEFTPVPETDSVCCAFAYIQDGGVMVPLLADQARDLRDIPAATTIPTLLTRDEALLRRALHALLQASTGGESGLTLDQVFGSSVSRQGRRGAAPRVSSSGFEVESTSYASGADLVQAAIEALLHGSLGHLDVHDQRQPAGEYLPLLGAAAVLALVAFFDRYFGGGDGAHAHWGAISMSGYPPLAQGYFGRRATRRSMRQLGEGLRPVAEFASDLRFALLPAPLLSLLPPAEFQEDGEAVGRLLERVVSSTDRPGGDPNEAQGQISTVVRDWLETHAGRLSPYYLNRFGVARSVYNGTRTVPADGRPADLGVLADLSMQQASMVLGALITHSKTVREAPVG
jgi:hypothetical protein